MTREEHHKAAEEALTNGTNQGLMVALVHATLALSAAPERALRKTT